MAKFLKKIIAFINMHRLVFGVSIGSIIVAAFSALLWAWFIILVVKHGLPMAD